MILIYGKGKVGTAVAELCTYLDQDFVIVDDTDAPSDFSKYTHIIPSPGIPSSHTIYQTGKVLCELDFAHKYLPETFTTISITGTDGKSTTAWMLYKLLEQEYGEEKTYLSGNFDIPFSTTVLDILKNWKKRGYIVLEISSFMSYAIESFQSTYSLITNLVPDHLNWHSDLGDYYKAKLRLLEHTTKKVILDQDTLTTFSQHASTTNIEDKIRLISENSKDRVEYPYVVVSGRKKYHIEEDSAFIGMHNAKNILMATMITNELKICSKRTKTYLPNISHLPHRLETISQTYHRTWVDDSKSTSPQSLEAALKSYNKPVILIAGGSDKGADFSHMQELFQSQVSHAILLGETREILAQYIDSYEFVDSMQEAVEKAYNSSTEEDIILLSPGCASFGLFKNYKDRADQFKKYVNML